MRRRAILACLLFAGCVGFAAELAAQSWPSALDQAPYGIPSERRGPGAYFAWYKLLCLVLAYLPWVGLSHAMNRDLLKWGKDLELSPQVWNLSNVLAFLVGFMVAISLPWFWAGFPILVVAALTMPTIYYVVRRSRVKSSERLRAKMIGKEQAAAEVGELPQETGINLEFFAPGGTLEDQKRLILARQSPAFVTLKNLVGNAVLSRVDNMILDYSATTVRGQMHIDGAWHPTPEIDRQLGDDLLTSMKLLARLNPRDRRNRQSGVIQYKWPLRDIKSASVELTTQGVPTGERAVLKFVAGKTKVQTLSELGMSDSMRTSFLQATDHAGLVVISAPPRQGLTSTWRASLLGMDRMTRDCVALVAADHHESEVENVAIRRFETGQTPDSILPSVLLIHPQVFVVPDLVDRASLESLVDEVLEEQRTVITRLHAQSAAEALWRVASMAGDRQRFAQAVTAVTSQRLLRRLCDHCKFTVQVRPDLIQRLGGQPSAQNVIYQVRQPNTVPSVDDEGKPIEYVPCPHCRGLGYLGRVAAYELMQVNDEIRRVLVGDATVASIEQAARKSGHRVLLQMAYQLVLSGTTTMAEVQRVFQEPQPART